MHFPEAYPPRFRDHSDALLYMECVQKGRRFPPGKVVSPFMRVGDMIVLNPEYRDAPFERTLISHPLALDNLKA